MLRCREPSPERQTDSRGLGTDVAIADVLAAAACFAPRQDPAQNWNDISRGQRLGASVAARPHADNACPIRKAIRPELQERPGRWRHEKHHHRDEEYCTLSEWHVARSSQNRPHSFYRAEHHTRSSCARHIPASARLRCVEASPLWRGRGQTVKTCCPCAEVVQHYSAAWTLDRAASAALRIARMFSPYVAGLSTEPPLNTADPATRTSAPAPATSGAVVGSTPPSISM